MRHRTCRPIPGGTARVSLAAPLLLLLLLPSSGAAQWLRERVPERPAPDSVAVDAGRRIYEARCWFCHGEDGDGNGPVASYLWPRPRDFTAGSYKLRTTESGELPTDEDLYRTVTRGIPGTAMPEWGSVLTPEQRWQVIAYIKSFAADLFEDEALNPYDYLVRIGEPPEGSEDSLVAQGSRVFEEADCWECHGAVGRGDGERAPELTDDWEFPTLPADLHLGWRFKGGSTVREIYLRLSSGLDGTPMPSYSETLSEEERWRLAFYVASLREDPERPSARAVLPARRVAGPLPLDPEDAAWETAPEAWIPLTGQATYAPRWQTPAVTELAVQALYNAEEIVLRLTWDDRFADTLPADEARALAEGWEAEDTYPELYPGGARLRGTYADAAEILLPARYDGGPVLPHFVYGNPGAPVQVWQWQADRGGADAEVVELRSAGGAAPPRAIPPGDRPTTASGAWREGRWRVVVRRPFEAPEPEQGTNLRPGSLVPIAFHIRDGSNGETGLRMAISSWYFLHLEKPAPAKSYLAVLLVAVGVLGLELGLGRWLDGRARRGELSHYGVRSSS
ncbi:MAG: c-type cytochrome [Gemmatimonadota bacterium]